MYTYARDRVICRQLRRFGSDEVMYVHGVVVYMYMYIQYGHVEQLKEWTDFTVELYTPVHVCIMSGILFLQPQNQRKKDLQYAEVQIVEGSPKSRHFVPVSERPSTHYTSINEESTRAFLRTCNARKEDLNNQLLMLKVILYAGFTVVHRS